MRAVCQKFTSRASVTDGLLVLLASVFIGLIGQLAIRLPFSPVPIYLQNNAICLAGFLLGRKRGVACAMLFIAQGAMGLPVFANGSSGIAYLMGPTGGYIFGFILSAYIAGYLAERKGSALGTFNALNLALIAHYVTGCLYLSTFIGFPQCFWLGVVPHILWDLMVNMAISNVGHHARSLLPR